MFLRVLVLMTILISVGVFISWFISPTAFNDANSVVQLLRVGLENIPAWFGAIAGIFGSTFLSYFYAIEKQQKDDLKKQHEQNIKSAMQIFITIANCIEQLKSIKDVYMEKIRDQDKIERSFKTLTIVCGELNKASIDATSLWFLVNPNGDDISPFTARNPIFVQSAIGQYNDALTLALEKKKMGDELIAKIYENNTTKKHNSYITFDPSIFWGTKTFQDVINFIKLSEFFFSTVEQSIDTLSVLSLELTKEMKQYVKKHDLKEKVLKYENKNHIFIRPPALDVDTEIQKLFVSFLDTKNEINFSKFKY